MKKLVLLFFISLSLVTAMSQTNSDSKKSTLKLLSGVYSDSIPYNYGNAWGKRTFTFENGRWSLTFILSLDPQMKDQVFQFRTFGSYIIEDKHPLLTDTYLAVFFEEKKFLTLLTSKKELHNLFGFTLCNLSIGKEEDISENGCSLWASVKECPADYDLLSIDNEGRVYFGTRPKNNNMCVPELRPISLTPPVIKQ
jgi:predicted nucleotidyltransferase